MLSKYGMRKIRIAATKIINQMYWKLRKANMVVKAYQLHVVE